MDHLWSSLGFESPQLNYTRFFGILAGPLKDHDRIPWGPHRTLQVSQRFRIGSSTGLQGSVAIPKRTFNRLRWTNKRSLGGCVRILEGSSLVFEDRRGSFMLQQMIRWSHHWILNGAPHKLQRNLLGPLLIFERPIRVLWGPHRIVWSKAGPLTDR